VEGAAVIVAPGAVGSATATCPVGSTVVGTGFDTSIGIIGFVLRFGNSVGIAAVNDTSINIDIQAQAGDLRERAGGQ
jgi:hypothetical protein